MLDTRVVGRNCIAGPTNAAMRTMHNGTKQDRHLMGHWTTESLSHGCHAATGARDPLPPQPDSLSSDSWSDRKTEFVSEYERRRRRRVGRWISGGGGGGARWIRVQGGGDFGRDSPTWLKKVTGGERWVAMRQSGEAMGAPDGAVGPQHPWSDGKGTCGSPWAGSHATCRALGRSIEQPFNRRACPLSCYLLPPQDNLCSFPILYPII
jgi:hypothetical protein